jgi:hypothetical protein
MIHSGARAMRHYQQRLGPLRPYQNRRHLARILNGKAYIRTARHDVLAASERSIITVAYASLIAFEKGGIVGRTGPALVHQDEAVLPRKLTAMLQGAAGHGNTGREIVVNYHAHVSAIDTKGISDLLREHGEQFSTHFASEMRRRNM